MTNWIVVEDTAERAKLLIDYIPIEDNVLWLFCVKKDLRSDAEAKWKQKLIGRRNCEVKSISTMDELEGIALTPDAIMLLDIDLKPIAEWDITGPVNREDTSRLRTWAAKFIARVEERNLIYVTSRALGESEHVKHIPQIAAQQGGTKIPNLAERVTDAAGRRVYPTHDPLEIEGMKQLTAELIADAKGKWIRLYKTDTRLFLEILNALPPDKKTKHDIVDVKWVKGSEPGNNVVKTLRDVLRVPNFEMCFCENVEDNLVMLRGSIRHALKSLAGCKNGVTPGGIWLLGLCALRDAFPQIDYRDYFNFGQLEGTEWVCNDAALAICGLATTKENLPKTVYAVYALFRACFQNENKPPAKPCNLDRVSVTNEGVSFLLKHISGEKLTAGLAEAYGDLCDRAIGVSGCPPLQAMQPAEPRHGLSSLLLVTMLGGRICSLPGRLCTPNPFSCNISGAGEEIEIAFDKRI